MGKVIPAIIVFSLVIGFLWALVWPNIKVLGTSYEVRKHTLKIRLFGRCMREIPIHEIKQASIWRLGMPSPTGVPWRMIENQCSWRMYILSPRLIFRVQGSDKYLSITPRDADAILKLLQDGSSSS